MLRKNYNKVVIILIILVFLSGKLIIVDAFVKLGGPKKKDFKYYDYMRDEEWLVAQAYGTTVGELRTYYIDDPYETVTVRQAVSYGKSVSDGRWIYSEYYEPRVKNTYIRVVVHDKNNIPSALRITDPIIFDNSQDTGLSADIIEYALNILWEFVTTYIKLPIPSPWSLITQDDDSNYQLNYDSDLMGFTVKFVKNPDLMGIDYIWRVNQPVNEGSYFIDVYLKGKVELYVYSSYEPYFWIEDLGNINILLFSDFYIFYEE